MINIVSVFNHNGDEIRVSSDMVEYYSSIGWNQVVQAADEDPQETEVEEFE